MEAASSRTGSGLWWWGRDQYSRCGWAGGTESGVSLLSLVGGESSGSGGCGMVRVGGQRWCVEWVVILHWGWHTEAGSHTKVEGVRDKL